MNILIATSEADPFAKTGGLADVCGALPIEISRLGHQVAVIMPAFRQTFDSGQKIEPLDIHFKISIGSKVVNGSLLRSHLPHSDVPVYLVQQDDYYDRSELYGENGTDYKDNCERFIFFCRAVLESIRLLNLRVDLLHCNDWQTGLIPALLKIEYGQTQQYDHIASLLTIHNLAYQGQFWHWDMLLTGLDWKYFNWHEMEFYGQLNLLKTGLVFSDYLTTVSPTYAQEIQGRELGCGLEGVLQQRSDVLSGVINGVDYNQWNPAIDNYIPQQFDVTTWQQGKAACKAALQREMGLPVLDNSPLVGLVGRLADQKGWQLVAEVMRKWAESVDVQWVILGTGDPVYHELLTSLATDYPSKVAARLEFSNALAHRIEAASDIFLMPSLYEPCGLNQLYSLKYGTVPVVRTTGGLADTITDASDDNLTAGIATGFRFDSFDALSLEHALSRACETYRNRPDLWQQLVTTAMNQDWSWTNSARQTIALYEKTISLRKEAVCV